MKPTQKFTVNTNSSHNYAQQMMSINVSMATLTMMMSYTGRVQCDNQHLMRCVNVKT